MKGIEPACLAWVGQQEEGEHSVEPQRTVKSTGGTLSVVSAE